MRLGIAEKSKNAVTDYRIASYPKTADGVCRIDSKTPVSD